MNAAHMMSMAVDQAQEILRLKDAKRELVDALRYLTQQAALDLPENNAALIRARRTLDAAGAA